MFSSKFFIIVARCGVLFKFMRPYFPNFSMKSDFYNGGCSRNKGRIPETPEAKQSVTVPYRVICLNLLVPDGAGGEKICDTYCYGAQIEVRNYAECENGSQIEKDRKRLPMGGQVRKPPKL